MEKIIKTSFLSCSDCNVIFTVTLAANTYVYFFFLPLAPTIHSELRVVDNIQRLIYDITHSPISPMHIDRGSICIGEIGL